MNSISQITGIVGIDDILNFVDDIESEYQQSLGLILSEDDLKCLLYGRIHNFLVKKNQHSLSTSENNHFASPLHSEIKFLGAEGKLTIRPDITILDTQNLSILKKHNGFDTSRKGFVFWGSAIVIEIKFCKSITGITAEFSRRVRADCKKINDLRARLYPEYASEKLIGVVVVFNRTDIYNKTFKQLLVEHENNPDTRIIYKTAQFAPQNKI